MVYSHLYILYIFGIRSSFTSYFILLGSSLAVLPLEDYGRKSKTMPLLHAHADTVTDMDFSPFHDGLLATGSQDCLVNYNYFTTVLIFINLLIHLFYNVYYYRSSYGIFQKLVWKNHYVILNVHFPIVKEEWKWCVGIPQLNIFSQQCHIQICLCGM